jgi:hypothetical protein
MGVLEAKMRLWLEGLGPGGFTWDEGRASWVALRFDQVVLLQGFQLPTSTLPAFWYDVDSMTWRISTTFRLCNVRPMSTRELEAVPGG